MKAGNAAADLVFAAAAMSIASSFVQKFTSPLDKGMVGAERKVQITF